MHAAGRTARAAQAAAHAQARTHAELVMPTPPLLSCDCPNAPRPPPAGGAAAALSRASATARFGGGAEPGADTRTAFRGGGGARAKEYAGAFGICAAISNQIRSIKSNQIT